MGGKLAELGINRANSEHTSLVEEGVHDDRPYRKYSDGSFKAATSEGWKKFNNFEELREFHAKRSREKRANKPNDGVLVKIARWFN